MTSITVRIPDDLKKELEALDIKVSAVTRQALRDEVDRIKKQKAREAADKLGELLADLPDDEIVKIIRESRDQR